MANRKALKTMNRTVKRVERHIVVKDMSVDHICFLSKNLYNYCNFILRNVYLGEQDSEKWSEISGFIDLIEKFEIKRKPFQTIKEYKLTTRLAATDQVDYRALPAQTSQQIIKLLYKNWKSFFQAIKAYQTNPKKFSAPPSPPKCKDRVFGRNIVIFTNQQAKIRNGFIYFVNNVLKPLKTKVEKLKQVRVIPTATCIVIEVVYDKEVKRCDSLNRKLYLGIDLGLNNLATCVNNIGIEPFIVNGKIAKSTNQYYNKRKAYLQGFVNNKGSARIRKLTLKRNCKIEDYFHKASRFIIDYCLTNSIGTIVVGKNDGWKDRINFKKETNQKFVCIPHNKLISQLHSKAEEVGIIVVETEESYTSKCSFIDLEEMKHHEKYLGMRTHRGLFRSKNNIRVNADVNGAYNIIRKVFPTIFGNKGQGIEGLGLNPMVINAG